MHSEERSIKWTDWVVVGLGLMLAVRTGANVFRLWKAGERLTTLEAQVEAAKIENIQLKGKLALVNSPEYVEKEAREKLGYGREGEVMVLLPQEKEEVLGQTTASVDGKEEKPKANWQKWWELYFGTGT